MKLKDLEKYIHGPVIIQYASTKMPGTSLIWQAYGEYEIQSIHVEKGTWDMPEFHIILAPKDNLVKVVQKKAQWSDKMVGYYDAYNDFHAGYQCSECHAILNKTKYCGNCGAKMSDEKQAAPKQRMSYDDSRAYILKEKPTLIEYLEKGWLHDNLLVEICKPLSGCSFTSYDKYQCMNTRLIEKYAKWYVANLYQDVATRDYGLLVFKNREEAKIFGN